MRCPCIVFRHCCGRRVGQRTSNRSCIATMAFGPRKSTWSNWHKRHCQRQRATDRVYPSRSVPEGTDIKCNSADRATDQIDPKIDPKNAQKLPGGYRYKPIALPETGVTLHSGDIGNTSGLCEERKVPWQECYKMDERLRFVARLLDGETTQEV